MAVDLGNQGISDALVVLGAAGLVIPTFARARISPVIGFILVGLLVGPAGLGAWVSRFPWLYYVTISNPAAMEPIAEVGIILLLFTIGLHLSFRRLWAMRRQVFGIGSAELLIVAALIGGGLSLLGATWQAAAALGLALALSSTALVLPLTGTSSPLGRACFAVLLLQDLALVPIVFVLGAIAPGAATGWGPVASTLLIGAATVAAMYAGGRLLLPPLFAQAARTKSPELFLAASLLVAIAASLGTAAAGLSPIVGALLAGLLIAETAYHDQVEAIVQPFQGLALGVFLITIGMKLNPALIAAHWPMLVTALVGVVAVKAVVMAGLLRWGGARWSVATEGALLMGSPGELSLVVLGVATAGALLSTQEAAFWQAVTALGLTLTPVLARVGQAAGRRVDLNATPAGIGVGEAGPGTVLIGFGRVGRMVADLLAMHGRPWIAVDSDVDGVIAARRENLPVIFGDVARAELVERLGLDRADALVLTMNDPVLSVRIARKVRAAAPDLTIIARARDAAHAAELYRAGVTDAVPETLESSLQLSEAVLVDLGVAMGPVIASIHEKRDQLRQVIRESAALDREPRIQRVRGRSEGVAG
jgi:monovalent cation:H+ antiporter-2, CPA2 family